MLRKRERFERSDVPRDTPYRNVIGGVVCVLVLAAVVAVVLFVWNRVKLESNLGDKDISDALSAQAAQATPEAAGYVASGDEFESVVLFTADGLDAVGPSLASARILTINRTQGTAALVTVPAGAKVDSETPATLAEAYASQGYAACVGHLSSATGVTFDHVVVATEDVLDEAAAIAGSGITDVVSQASELLSKIRTDMDAAELMSLAEALSAVGANLVSSEAVLVPEAVTDEAGNPVETGAQLIERSQLCVALGLLVPAA